MAFPLSLSQTFRTLARPMQVAPLSLRNTAAWPTKRTTTRQSCRLHLSAPLIKGRPRHEFQLHHPRAYVQWLGITWASKSTLCIMGVNAAQPMASARDASPLRLQLGADVRVACFWQHNRRQSTKVGQDSGTNQSESIDAQDRVVDVTFQTEHMSNKIKSAKIASAADLEGIDRSLYNEVIQVRMPDMGEGQGKILHWYKQPGDIVQRDDVLCDIETPDFTFGMETEDEHVAIMGEILIQAPSGPVADNTVICHLLHLGSGKSTGVASDSNAQAVKQREESDD